MACARSQLILTLVAALCMTVAACGDEPVRDPPPGLPRLTSQTALAAVDSQARTGRNPESVETWLALAIPGFGGFGYDTANGDLMIWVKDVRRGPAARAAVAEYLRTNYRGNGGRAGPNPPVRIEKANFDFLELGSVRDRVNEVLATDPALYGVGISVLINRVQVDVNTSAIDRIRATLERAGVPIAAVHLTGSSSGPQLEPYPAPVR